MFKTKDDTAFVNEMAPLYATYTLGWSKYCQSERKNSQNKLTLAVIDI